jgi:hypothetical protein
MGRMIKFFLNVYLFAHIITAQEIDLRTTFVFGPATTVSHDAPTDSRGCHKGPDGKVHCH